MQKERIGKPSPFSSDNCRPRKALASGEGQPSQTLKNTPKREPSLHRYYSALCVRACVRGSVCARAQTHRSLGSRLSPSGSSSFPACFGPAKWEGETQDGGSRELRLQPTAVRLPDLVSGGATSAGVAWPALACAGRAADFSQRAERPKHLGTD